MSTASITGHNCQACSCLTDRKELNGYEKGRYFFSKSGLTKSSKAEPGQQCC